MSLEHELILVKLDDSSALTDINFYINIREHALIDNCSVLFRTSVRDNLIAYFIDYLSWIPSKKYYDNLPINGINRCGITIFDYTSKEKLLSVLNSIRELFKNAPDSIILHGETSIESNGDINIEKIKFNKLDFLIKIDSLINAVGKLGNNEYYLIHLGV